AFIDIGMERAAFLHVEDLIRPDDFEAYLAGGSSRANEDGDEPIRGDAARRADYVQRPSADDDDDDEPIVAVPRTVAEAAEDDADDEDDEDIVADEDIAGDEEVGADAASEDAAPEDDDDDSDPIGQAITDEEAENEP